MPLIAVDGIDGAGKTTFCETLADYIQEAYGFNDEQIVISSDLRFSPFADSVRALFVSGDLQPLTELYLICAARAQHLDEVVMPALNAGHVVILDRYLLSTMAYQGTGGGLHNDALVHALTPLCAPFPDLQLVLVLPQEIAQARLQARGGSDAIEQRCASYQHRIAVFFDSASRHPVKFGKPQQRILSDQSQADMLAQAKPALTALFKQRAH